MKKEISLINLVDYLTEGAVKILKKIGKLVNSKNSHDIVFIFTKVIVTLLVIAFLNIPFTIIKDLGIILIYEVGNTFRYLLSISWSMIIYLSYFLLGIVVLLKVFKTILKDKELNLIEQNRRKDTHVKKKVFVPIIELLKLSIVILSIPLFIAVAIILMAIGMSLCLIVNGYGLFCLLFMLVGLLIMISSAILLLFNIRKEGNE